MTAHRGTDDPPGADSRPSAPLLTPSFLRLTLADLGYFTSVGLAVYVLPRYVTGPLGSDEAGAGLAFGAFAVSALVLRPYAGRLSDTIGRRPLLVGGALLCAVAMALTPTAATLQAVVALRLLLGVAEAAFFVASFAALADLAPPGRLGEALSYNSLGLYLGLALGPPLGEVLLRTAGFATAWSGAAVLALLAAVTVHGIGETGTPRPRRSGRVVPPLIHRGALAPAAGFVTSVVAMGGFLAFAALHAEGVGLTRTSEPLLVYGGVVVACRLLFAKVPDRVPPLPLGAAALALMTAGLALVAVRPTSAGLLGGAAVMALGVSFSTPAFFAAVFSRVGPAERGAASGTLSVALDLGLGAGPILLGLVARGAGLPVMFGVGAGVALLGCVWTLLLVRPGLRSPAGPPRGRSRPRAGAAAARR